MSLLKTTLKVESASIFPTAVNYTAIANNQVTGDSNFGKLSLSHGTTLDIAVNDLSGKGKYLYVSSPSSNPENAGIEIVGEAGDVIITVFPGESGFAPISTNQGNLQARTTWGPAELDYFIGNRGDAAGQSAIIFSYDSSTTWKYFIMDSASCVPTEEYDTGFLINEWTMNLEYFVQNKGYIIRFGNIEVGYNLFYFVDAKGRLIEQFNTNNVTHSTYTFSGKGFGIKYTDGLYLRWKHFDGDAIYNHEFYNATSISPEFTYDDSAANGTFALYVFERDGIVGQETHYLIKGDRKTLLADTNYDDTLIIYDVYLYDYTNFCFVTEFDDDSGLYLSFSIFDLSGSLLKKITLDVADSITDFEYQFYGSTGLQVVLLNNDDTTKDYILFNYNQKTGRMIGEDKTWVHPRGVNYPNFTISGNTYSLISKREYNRDSVVVAFHKTIDTNFDWLTGTEVTFLDLHYIIDDGNLRTHTVTTNSTLFVALNSVNPTNTDAQLLWSEDSTSGALNSLVLTKTGEPTSFQVIANLINVYSNDSHQWFPAGDYRVLFYTGDNDGDGPAYSTVSVIKGAAILDTVTVNDDNQNFTIWERNSILWSPLNTSYYFNVKTNKWVNLTKEYGVYTPNWGVSTTGLSSGFMLLVSIDNPLSIQARILSGGTISNEVQIAPSVYTESFDWSISEKNFIFGYADPTKNSNWQYDVYDLNLKKLYSFDSGLPIVNISNTVNNRSFFLLRNSAADTYKCFMLSNLLNHKTITIGENDPNIVINDYDWWND
jgi:hypothetical protein